MTNPSTMKLNRQPSAVSRQLSIIGSVFFIFHFSFFIFADTFSIEGGGAVEGRLLNPGERIRQIETPSGVILSLDFGQIRETGKDDNESLAHYKRTVPFLPDTVESHLEIAAWCREKYLKEQENVHLNRVLDLDPDHAETRKRLGYFRDAGGQWTTTEEVKSANGYVRDKGSWRMPQEIWINKQVQQRDEVNKDWKQDIKKIRSSLDNPAIRRKLEGITDPAAVKPINDLLKKENVPEIRMVLIRALSSIGTPEAVGEIAHYAMNDPVEDVRRICLDQIKQHPNRIPQAGAYFSRFLNNQNSDETFVNPPDKINQAAAAIRLIGDTSSGSIGSLITALVSQHKETIEIGSERTNVSMGGGGGTGFSQGVSKQDIIKPSQNAEVLLALRRLTGVDFGYDKAAWKRWLMEKRQVSPIDLRRGG